MVKILIEDFAPSRGEFSYIDDSIKLRSGRRDIESSIRIVRLLESSFYNRVIDYSDEKRYDYTDDGTLIINSPCIFNDNRQSRKIQSNAYFPAGSVIIAINIKHEDLENINPADVLNFAQQSIFEIVRKFTSITKIQMINNDIVFDEKKFYGEEIGGYDDCYSITGICTCDYEANKDIFDNLRGHGVREITGITDEIPELTQEYIIDELYKRALNIFGGAK